MDEGWDGDSVFAKFKDLYNNRESLMSRFLNGDSAFLILPIHAAAFIATKVQKDLEGTEGRPNEKQGRLSAGYSLRIRTGVYATKLEPC